jgi:spore coat protein U-like protein
MNIVPTNGKKFVVAVLALATLPTSAQTNLTATAIMPVRMEIVASCLVSVSDLDFGAYASNSTTAALGQTTIELQCGAETTAEIALDAGTGSTRNTSRRRLQQDSGSDRLDYDLFQDAGRTIHWGDKSGSDTKEVLTTGAPQTVPIYGEILARQRARDGTYSDMITVTVQY